MYVMHNYMKAFNITSNEKHSKVYKYYTKRVSRYIKQNLEGGWIMEYTATATLAKVIGSVVCIIG